MKVKFKKEYGQLVPYSESDKEALSKLADGAVYEVNITNFDLRTSQQNRALHKYFAMVATALSESGQDVKKVIKTDVPWTAESVKELMWKPILKAVLNKDSTTKMTKDEIDKVYDIMNRALGERCGISVPFPNKEI